MKPVGEWSVGPSYGAVVSTAPEDSAYPGGADEETVKAYGGHLVAESISTEMRPVIAAVPKMIKALEAAEWLILSDYGGTKGVVGGGQATIELIRAALTEAGCR